MGIASFVLGLVSILLVSLDMDFTVKFAYGFLSIFFAVFLGVIVIKKIKNYRDHLVDTGFAIAGGKAALYQRNPTTPPHTITYRLAVVYIGEAVGFGPAPTEESAHSPLPQSDALIPVHQRLGDLLFQIIAHFCPT